MNVDISQFDLFGIALGVSLGINILFWVPASILKTEKFYDGVGSLTFILLTVLSLLSREIRTRQLIVSCLVFLWTARLGTFLVYRVIQAGEDKRFAELKVKPLRFLVPWILQGIWCWATLLSVLILNLQDDGHFERDINWADILGWAIYALGLIVETVADLQKIVWRKNPENKGKWIAYGLWYYSRHPNYFGEVTLWVGIFVACAANFQGAEFVGVISPLFVFALIYFISGVPLLEQGADERWSGNPDYIVYKANTSVFVLLASGCWRRSGVISPLFVFALIYFVSGVPLLEQGADERWGDNPDYIVYKANTSVFVPLPYGCCCGSGGAGTIEKSEKLNKDSDRDSKSEVSDAERVDESSQLQTAEKA